MKKMVFLILGATLLSSAALAEDSPEKVCKSAAELYNDGDLEGALEEAKWCVTLLEQEKQAATNQFFKDEINGFVGGELEQQNAMGFMMTNRSYEKDGMLIDVNLSAGSAGGAMQAFSAIAQLGMQSGAGKKMRIQKRTAMASNDGGSATVTITLKSGGMLQFESRDVSLDTVVEFAKAFPVEDLDNANN